MHEQLTPPDQLPTLTELLIMHELMLARFGGMRGITEQGFGKLEAAVAAPYQSAWGEEVYPDLPSKAAALFYGLIRAHGLSDGNKRVALVALLEVAARNGYRLALDDEAVYQFVLAAADHLGRDEVTTRLAACFLPL